MLESSVVDSFVNCYNILSIPSTLILINFQGFTYLFSIPWSTWLIINQHSNHHNHHFSKTEKKLEYENWKELPFLILNYFRWSNSTMLPSNLKYQWSSLTFQTSDFSFNVLEKEMREGTWQEGRWRQHKRGEAAATPKGGGSGSKGERVAQLGEGRGEVVAPKWVPCSKMTSSGHMEIISLYPGSSLSMRPPRNQGSFAVLSSKS